MPDSLPDPDLPPLPGHWARSVQAALVHAISLAHYAVICARSRMAPQSARVDGLKQEIALDREKDRIKDARLARIPAAQRPHYLPTERLAVLELRAARGWSLAQTATVFQVSTATIASWTKRLDEQGPAALLSTSAPVNQFPDFVRYIVQRLQTLCPRLGKVKIAQMLARAGLHLSATTIGRMRREQPSHRPSRPAEPMPSARRVKAKCPNHVWHVDLTTVPTSAGFWASWLPFALPQCWPFCWWLGVAVDHFSRRSLGFAVFRGQPTSEQVRQFLGRVIGNVGAAPKYLVTDSGTQFKCAGFAVWCHRHSIRQRLGAVGKSGSIAVVERFIRTLKDGCTRLLPIVPMLRRSFHRELQLFVSWYNGQRPHMTLEGATPDEVYFHKRPSCRKPRFEPRSGWPRGSPCASPRTLVKGQPGVELQLTVDFLANRRHLPRVTVTRVA